MEKMPLDIVLTPEAAEIYDYIQKPDDQTKRRLVAKYEPILAEATRKVIEIIKEAEQDPQYKRAFEYDGDEAQRLLKANKITMADYYDSPDRKITGKLIHRLDDTNLYQALTFLQILKYHQKKPGKRVTGKMADAISAQVKQIQKQTNITRPLLSEFARSTSQGSMIELFVTYQYEPYLDIRKRGYAATLEQEAIIQELNKADIDDKRAQLIIDLQQDNIKKNGDTIVQTWSDLAKLFDETGIPQRVEETITALYSDEAQITPLEKPGALDIFTVTQQPNTQAVKYTYMALNSPDRMGSTKPKEVMQKQDPLTGALSVNIRTTDNDLLFIFTGKISAITNGPKLFSFFLSKACEQHWPDEGIKFNLRELVENGIYSDITAAYRGLENSVTRMQDIDIGGTVTGYEGRKRKQIRSVGGALISWRDITYTKCIIKLPPIYNAGYIPFMPITDPNYYKLPIKAFMLYTYIMSCARQSANAQKIKRQGYFTISLDALRIYLGLPSIEEAGKDPKRLIVDPIEKALGEIMDSAGQDGLKIEINAGGYDEGKARPPVSEYLRGYIKITLDEVAGEIIEERAGAKSEKIEEAKKKAQKTANREKRGRTKSQ